MPSFNKAHYACASFATLCALVIAFWPAPHGTPEKPALRLTTLEPSPSDMIVAATPPAPIAAPVVTPLAHVAEPTPVPARAEAQKETAASVSGIAPGIAFVAPPPARFFTINQVMAKRGGRSAPPAPVRLASLDNTPSVYDSAPSYAPRDSKKPFGMTAFRAPDGLLWSKWRRIERELKKDASVISACRAEAESCKSREARHYISVVDKAKTLQGRQRLQEVHKAVNISIHYLSDMAQHHTADLWSTALASFTTGYGDCEDYAIANFEILRDAGVAADDMQILLVRDKFKNEGHAVLAVRDSGTWLILDSRKPYLVEAKDVPQYIPLYAIDQSGVKLFAAPYAMKSSPVREKAALPIFAEIADLNAASWAFRSSLD